MKAIRLIQPGHPLQMHDVPGPRAGPDDVLVRIKAAGICRSDAHYRAGISPVEPLPLTLGHEVAGVVEQAGASVSDLAPGDRVCLHYLATCGSCLYCGRGLEQFCSSASMIGKHRDGGYAEFILMPARSVFSLPDEIPFEQGAIMMCSSATSLHALNKTRLRAGETVAVFGIGGLGLSAIQLAKGLGASSVLAVDVKEEKLKMAAAFGALPVNATQGDPVTQINNLTAGRGVDVALELIGLPITMQQAVRCLAIQGRAGLVGITDKKFEIAPYAEVLNKETEIIGVADHLATEVQQLISWVKEGKLDLSKVITTRIPLEPQAVNDALDRLEKLNEPGRVVIQIE